MYTEQLPIHLWREKKGLTQEQLAQLSGIPRPNLSNIERGSTDPTLSTLSKIARAMNLTLSLLLSPPASFTKLNRHEIDAVARAIINGERKLSGELNELTDECAALMVQKLQAHQSPGYSTVKRLKADKGLKKARLFEKYNASLIKQILQRTNKFL